MGLTFWWKKQTINVGRKKYVSFWLQVIKDRRVCVNPTPLLAAALSGDCRWAEQQGEQLRGDGKNPGKRQGWLGSGWW